MKILIATPCYGGLLTTQYFMGFLKTFAGAADEEVAIGTYTLSNESLIQRGRNRCAAAFLNSPVKWDKLFFVDADIGFDWPDVKKLIDSKQPLIGGMVPIKNYPIGYNFNPIDDHRKYFSGTSRSREEVRALVKDYGSPIVPVKHIGTPFLMIDRSVIEATIPLADKYEYPCFVSGQTEIHYDLFRTGVSNGSFMSEDFGFNELAKKAGIETFMHTDTFLTHTGSHEFKA